MTGNIGRALGTAVALSITVGALSRLQKSRRAKAKKKKKKKR